jgi:hypothetical protein
MTELQDAPRPFRIIGFAGLAGAGKDTAADVLLKTGLYYKVSFAEPLKLMLQTLLRQRGCENPERYTDGDLKEQPCEYLEGITPRWAMQSLGTEWGRVCISPDLWINTFKHRVRRLRDVHHVRGVVVTDVRFVNEVLAIRDLGGSVFRVIRGEQMPMEHASERQVAMLPVDGEIKNVYPSAEEFQAYVRGFFDTLHQQAA